MQKMKLELEVLRNAEHNNKYNLEKATKEVATLRLALEGCEKSRDAEVATLSVALEASQLHAVNEQRKAADAQRATAQQEKMAAELAAARKRAEIAEEGQRGAARGVNRVKNEFFASQASLAKTKQELVAATATVTATRYGRDQLAEEQRATARTINKVPPPITPPESHSSVRCFC
jgi:chromosome segregation ATPase